MWPYMSFLHRAQVTYSKQRVYFYASRPSLAKPSSLFFSFTWHFSFHLVLSWEFSSVSSIILSALCHLEGAFIGVHLVASQIHWGSRAKKSKQHSCVQLYQLSGELVIRNLHPKEASVVSTFTAFLSSTYSGNEVSGSCEGYILPCESPLCIFS